MSSIFRTYQGVLEGVFAFTTQKDPPVLMEVKARSRLAPTQLVTEVLSHGSEATDADDHRPARYHGARSEEAGPGHHDRQPRPRLRGGCHGLGQKQPGPRQAHKGEESVLGGAHLLSP